MKDTTASKAGVDPRNYRETLLLQDLYYGEQNTYYQERVIWTLKEQPDYAEGDFDFMFLNIPMFLYMTEMSMDEVAWRYLLIRVKDPEDHALIDEIADALT